MKSAETARTTGRGQQQGVVLFVALIVLVVMTLSGIALLRQMGVGTSIAGNIAFKESATAVADRGVEVARQWILANSAALTADSPANGYFASWGTSVDPKAFDWAGSSRLLTDEAPNGNTIRFIIHRLCAAAGPVAMQQCSESAAGNASGSVGGASYGNTPFKGGTTPFYRVTTRVEGPRGTVSFTQVLMN